MFFAVKFITNFWLRVNSGAHRLQNIDWTYVSAVAQPIDCDGGPIVNAVFKPLLSVLLQDHVFGVGVNLAACKTCRNTTHCLLIV